jgi:phosphatidate cytidylyltransferase
VTVTPGNRAAGPDSGRAQGRSELALRVLSSAVLAPVALLAAYLGGWVFVVFWTVAAIGVLWEWVGLVAPSQRTRLTVAGAVAIAASALAFGLGQTALAVILALLTAMLLAALGPSQRRLWSVEGALYATAVALAPIILRGDPELGLAAVVVLFGVVWSTDVAAYFAGRAIGGPRLWPAVSPKKTWSGALGGLLGGTIVGAALAHAWQLDLSPRLIAVLALLSVASQSGDLFESAVKRRYGAKDASHLIPGHGGLMDRLDGFVAAAVVSAVLGLARGGIDAPARGLLIW